MHLFYKMRAHETRRKQIGVEMPDQSGILSEGMNGNPDVSNIDHIVFIINVMLF